MTSTPAAAGSGVLRDTAAITALNLLSRLSGFVRVLVMGSALGTTALGDTYQSANLVSNVLFELLAGGILSAVLVPMFVERLAVGDRDGAARLAGVLLTRAVAGLSVIVLVGMASAPWIMDALTTGVDDAAVRHAQVELGSYLLAFFLPQVLLYAVGSVCTAQLQADRRFLAAAVAPVCNNLVVIVTMLVFAAGRSQGAGLSVSSGDKLVLAVGTTAGVVAMTVVPVLASGRAGLRPVLAWSIPGFALATVIRRGLWAAGHLGLNQVLVAVTVVLAARVTGGVIAYQIAFTFFLLPHAVLANPIFTAMYPRLAEDAVAARWDDFVDRLSSAMRLTVAVILPSAAVLVAVADPALQLVQLGNLDRAGAQLVGSVLAAYAVGLAGYSTFFLLTRASYALDDAVGPTLVNLAVVIVGVAGMAVASGATSDNAQVASLGIVHGVVVSIGAAMLFGRVQRRLRRRVRVLGSLIRSTAAALVGGVLGSLAVDAIDGGTKASALVAVLAGAVVVGVAYLAALAATGSTELREVMATVRRSR